MTEETLTAEQDRYVTKSLTNSVNRLARLLKANGPAVIVCNELVNVCVRAMLLYGDYYWKAWGDHMSGHVRNHFGYCATCQSKQHSVELSCPQCIRDGNEYVAQFDEPEGNP